MWSALPLLALPVAAYNVLAALMAGGFRASDAQARLTQPVFSVAMASDARWGVSLADVLLASALLVLFVELLKSTTSRHAAIINHGLSMLLFIVCLVEFLLAPAFATSTFFLVLLMVLLDVLAGFIVTIVSARRDVDFGDR